VNFSSVAIDAKFTSTKQAETTCPPALGYSFAGGTTDGPGDFPFEQDTTNATDNPFWEWAIGLALGKPSKEQVACQDPKAILFNVCCYPPLPWVENILPIQIARIGQLYLLGVPAEFTTMSGRRFRDTVYSALQQAGAPADAVVVIAGVSNSYSHYVTTYEEYQLQRYEGGSTLYGPHTLAAYQQLYTDLATALQTDKPVPPGPTPPDLTGHTFDFIPPVPVDKTPSNATFGSVNVDVQKVYTAPTQVLVSFWGGNLRNDFMIKSSFLTVELFNNSTNNWDVVYNDGAWETKLFYAKTTEGYCIITITWDVPDSEPKGLYRIGHFGYRKVSEAKGDIAPYFGYSSTFMLQ